MAKWVYMFSEGDMTMRNLLGGKGSEPGGDDKHRSAGSDRDLQSQLRLVPQVLRRWSQD